MPQFSYNIYIYIYILYEMQRWLSNIHNIKQFGNFATQRIWPTWRQGNYHNISTSLVSAKMTTWISEWIHNNTYIYRWITYEHMHNRLLSVRNICQTHTFLTETQRANTERANNLVTLYIYINIYQSLQVSEEHPPKRASAILRWYYSGLYQAN